MEKDDDASGASGDRGRGRAGGDGGEVCLCLRGHDDSRPLLESTEGTAAAARIALYIDHAPLELFAPAEPKPTGDGRSSHCCRGGEATMNLSLG